MAKRRERPTVNPLQEDLIAAAAAPVAPVQVPVSPLATAPPNAARATSTTKKPNKASQVGVARRERPTKTLRVRFPDTEFDENAELIKSLRKLMGGSKVTESDVTRALWSLARRAEEAMGEIKSKAPKTRRPANGDWISKAEYDDAVAHYLHLAIKRMGVRE